MAKLHVLALDATLNVTTQTQADYTRVNVEGPFRGASPLATGCSCRLQPDKNDVDFVPMELDEKVARVHLPAHGVALNVDTQT